MASRKSGYYGWAQFNFKNRKSNNFINNILEILPLAPELTSGSSDSSDDTEPLSSNTESDAQTQNPEIGSYAYRNIFSRAWLWLLLKIKISTFGKRTKNQTVDATKIKMDLCRYQKIYHWPIFHHLKL